MRKINLINFQWEFDERKLRIHRVIHRFYERCMRGPWENGQLSTGLMFLILVSWENRLVYFSFMRALYENYERGLFRLFGVYERIWALYENYENFSSIMRMQFCLIVNYENGNFSLTPNVSAYLCRPGQGFWPLKISGLAEISIMRKMR